MWNLIKQWLAKKACCHDWVEVDEDSRLFPNSIPRCTEQTLICKKCGKIKRIKV